MAKTKSASVAQPAPVLAELDLTKVYGWNVMSTCLAPDTVLEHKSKLDYFTLQVGRTAENEWVGGYLGRTAMGTLASSAVSLKNPHFALPAEAAQWAAGELLRLDPAEKLTPNARRKLAALAPKPVEAVVQPWLDCDGNVLLEGDKATVLPDVSERLSGKLVQVLGEYDPHKKSVQVEPVGWDGADFGILLCFLRRLPVLGEELVAAEPVPVEPETDLPFLNDSAKPTVAVSMEAWELLEKIVLLGVVPGANLGAPAGPPITELIHAKLVEYAPGGGPRAYQATAAGIAATQDDTPLPSTPLGEAADAHKAGLRVLPLTSIVVTRNTRKVFDEAALAELAESVKAHGILQPIVVRPHTEAGQYELVAGGRRYQAAQLAGLAEMPATVRTLTDREFLEVQLLENLQRVDVRPADEAEAFNKLLNSNFTAEEIGLKVGKRPEFVKQRAQLTKLIPFFMDALVEERLLLVSAHELARLPPHSQLVVKQHVAGSWGDDYPAHAIKDTIASKVTRDLTKAPWDLDDTYLVPSAGACTACPKRSTAQGLLFESAGPALCLDGGCFGLKVAAHVKLIAAALTTAGGKPPVQVTPEWRLDEDQKAAGVVSYNDFNWAQEGSTGAVQVLVVAGPEAGQVKYARITRATGPAGGIAAPQASAAAAQARAAAIRHNRIARTKNELWAGMLRDLLSNQLAGKGPEASGARALVDDFVSTLLTWGRSRITNDTLAYLQQQYGWAKHTEKELDNSSRGGSKSSPHEEYMRREMARMTILDKLVLYFDLKVIRDGLDQNEPTARQHNLVQLLPPDYQDEFEVTAKATKLVEERYYSKKGKKQEATA